MQGFNMGRYVPPNLEGTTSFNEASGKGHALGARARKLKTEGILTVRFECPFAIWCSNCKPEQIIGQGVRFNAEKKKVGNYYSTPIWSFRFKHSVCSGWIEVRTDPKNTEYVVFDGGRRRDTGDEKLLDGEIRMGAPEEDKVRLEREGGFGTLEKKVEDKQRLLGEKDRLEELEKRSKRDWKDPYEQSRRLRKEFRIGRKLRKDAESRGQALKDKLSLGIDLVDEREDDELRARLVEFGASEQKERAKPLFATNSAPKPSGMTRDEGKRDKLSSPSDLVTEKKSRLQNELSENTWAVLDPFLNEQKVWQPETKRKKAPVADIHRKLTKASATLVDYESDST